MTLRRKLGLGLFLATALGCNAIAGINEPIDGPRGGQDGGQNGGRDTGTGTQDTGTAPTGSARFVGTWLTTTGAQELSKCVPTDRQEPITAQFTMTTGTGSDIEAKFDGAPDCLFKFSVSGDTATVVPGQVCTVTGNVRTDNYSYNLMTFQLDAEGARGELRLVADLFVEPNMAECVFSEISVYDKQ